MSMSLSPQLLFARALLAMGSNRYDRVVCRDRFGNLTQDNPDYLSQNPSYFAFEAPDFTKITLEGCKAVCGSEWGPYPDYAGRLLSYIVPLLLLLVNMSYPTIEKKRFLLVFRVLGDPIGCAWYQLETLKTWADNRRRAETFVRKLPKTLPKAHIRNAVTLALSVATSQISSPELTHALDTAMESINNTDIPLAQREACYHKLLDAASRLANSRVVDIRRAIFAVVVYVLQVVVAVFTPSVLGSLNISGGRIAPPMLLAWLLPLVILNNAIGDCMSWKHAEDVLKAFVADTQHILQIEPGPSDQDSWNMLTRALLSPGYGLRPGYESVLSELSSPGPAVSGGAIAKPETAMPVTARPETAEPEIAKSDIADSEIIKPKSFEQDSSDHMCTYFLALCAAFPVKSAFTIASAVDLTPPTYFSCRMLFQILACIAWCSSACITIYLHLVSSSGRIRLGKWLPIIVLGKDIVVGMSIMTVVIVSTSGLFNSCYCSSGFIWRRGNAWVDLTPERIFSHNKKVYVACVTVGLAFQIGYGALTRESDAICDHINCFKISSTVGHALAQYPVLIERPNADLSRPELWMSSLSSCE